MRYNLVAKHITNWLSTYATNAKVDGFVIGISGGVDSALTSTLCALTGKKTILLSMQEQKITLLILKSVLKMLAHWTLT